MIALDLKGARVAIQGFGAVGKHSARFLARKGCCIVACSDSRCTVSSPGGLEVAGLIALKGAGKSVIDFLAGQKAGPEAILGIPCYVWIPAARPDVVNSGNVALLDARIVAQGANIPCTTEAEAMLEARSVLVLPDFMVNAGGVICAPIEYHSETERCAFEVIEDKIRRNTASVLETARRTEVSTRKAAIALASDRIHNAERVRRWQ